MQVHSNVATGHAKRIPWNKGKLPGSKPPLRPKHVWAIRTKLHVEGRKRDLALFNLAVDSKLRDCDIVSIRVEDIVPRSYAHGPTTGSIPVCWPKTRELHDNATVRPLTFRTACRYRP